jgi:DNA-binding NarL/FixJ family response regulator
MRDEPVRIVIAEDQHFFRDGLRTTLEKVPTLAIVAEASDGLTALECIRSLAPDLVILDIGLPRMNGVEVVRRIRAERLAVEVVFLTIHQHEDMFREALALGVKGYLAKDCSPSELLACVRAVSSGQHYTGPSMTTYLVGRTQRVEHFTRTTPGLQRLSSQELNVLRRIALGKSSKEIGVEMDIAPRTVDAHRANICAKLDIHGQHALTRFAMQHRDEI